MNIWPKSTGADLSQADITSEEFCAVEGIVWTNSISKGGVIGTAAPVTAFWGRVIVQK